MSFSYFDLTIHLPQKRDVYSYSVNTHNVNIKNVFVPNKVT